jgi:phosphoglycolate phosphatase-like HAD superfamily hydrolase
MRVPAAEAADVGDSPEDVEMSRAASAYVIGVPAPFPNRESLKASQPDLLCASFDAAISALLATDRV